MDDGLLNQEIDSLIPELSCNLAIYPFDKNTYLVHERNLGFHVRVNALTIELLKVVDGKKTIKEIVDVLTMESNEDISISDIYDILYGTLASNGIVKSNKKLGSKRGDYLKFKIPIFKEKYVVKISHILTSIFHPRYFVYSFLIMFVFITNVFIFNLDWKNVYNAITPANLLLFYIFSFFVTMAHEIGHATACRRFGAYHGDIGFAFYIFTPVFYADVSDAWKLKSGQRIIIDMAGIYMEFLIGSFLSIIYLLTLNPVFLIYAFFVILHTLYNLNPLFRYDAYWAVSDFLNIPNLRIESNKKLGQTLHWIIKKGKNPFHGGIDLFLVLYALSSISLLIIFLVSVLLMNSSSIINLPVNLFYFFKSIITDWNTLTFASLKHQLVPLIIPIVFYMVIIRMLIMDKSKWIKIFKY